jgi:Myb-like DNA-binding protein FlbD
MLQAGLRNTFLNQNRGVWPADEDTKLLSIIKELGLDRALNCVRISQQMQYRTPKQCRKRYHQHLEKIILDLEPIH